MAAIPPSPVFNPQDPDSVPPPVDIDASSATPAPATTAAEVGDAKQEYKSGGGKSSPRVSARQAPAASGAENRKTKNGVDAEAVGASKSDEVGAAQPVCDACLHCDDLCRWAACVRCNEKEKVLRQRGLPAPGKATFTMCQVARHTSEDDAWLVAHGVVYDATEILGEHPGGVRSIMRHAGQDCTQDFDFHSKAGRQLWNDLRIGRLVPCSKDGGQGNCTIM